MNQADEIKQLKAQLKAANEKIAELTAIIKLQQNQLFGKKTEVIAKITPGQQSLFSKDDLDQLQDDNVTITEVIEPQATKKVVRRRKKTNGPTGYLLKNLPQVDRVITVEDTNCPHCHQEMEKIGQHLYSQEAALKPAELYCVNYYQESYKCHKCDQHGQPAIISSTMPQSLLPHSYFSSSILAKVAELKFNLAVPFHRQIKLWQAIGLPVEGRQLATNIIKVSQTYLEPLYQFLQALMKKEAVIHMDETPFKVIEETKEQSYFWVTRTTKEFSHHQIVLYNYYNSRSGKTIGQIMGQGYQGVIMCDGYRGYSDRLYPQAKFGSCLVHIRREFYRIIEAANKPVLKHSHAQRVIELMAPIFHADKQIKYENAEEKCQQRQIVVRPLMDRFYDYISQIKFPQGRLKNAINNALQLKQRVYRIFEDGRIPLTNNAVEQEIRPSTLIRKNCLFAKTIAGARANAIYYSLATTARLNHLDIFKYFEYLFKHLPNHKSADLEAYLPWAPAVQVECHEYEKAMN